MKELKLNPFNYLSTVAQFENFSVSKENIVYRPKGKENHKQFVRYDTCWDYPKDVEFESFAFYTTFGCSQTFISKRDNFISYDEILETLHFFLDQIKVKLSHLPNLHIAHVHPRFEYVIFDNFLSQCKLAPLSEADIEIGQKIKEKLKLNLTISATSWSNIMYFKNYPLDDNFR